MSQEKTRAHIFIYGRVQGVGFRVSTQRQAVELEVDGWIRNLPDGRVEAVIEGPENKVKELLSWCEEGPRPAQVRHVKAEWEDFTGDFNGFTIRY